MVLFVLFCFKGKPKALTSLCGIALGLHQTLVSGRPKEDIKWASALTLCNPHAHTQSHPHAPTTRKLLRKQTNSQLPLLVAPSHINNVPILYRDFCF